MPLVYIILLNWNGWSDTLRCLESIFRQDYQNYRVIVCDNDSNDDSLARIEAWTRGEEFASHQLNDPLLSYSYPPVPKPIPYLQLDHGTPADTATKLLLLPTGDNLGFAGGNNVGIRYALARGADYVWLVNNDTVVDPQALQHMVALANDENIGMVGSMVLRYHQPDLIQAVGGGRVWPWGWCELLGEDEQDTKGWPNSVDLDFIVGSSLLVRRGLLERLGLMAEDYFLYWEDTDWGVRAKRQGWRLGCATAARVWHREGGTVGYKSPIQDYYAIRNALWFVRRHHPGYLFLAFCFHGYRSLLPKLVRGQWQRLGLALRGVVDFGRGRTGKLPT
ncbi:glycosyltransferase family 2 protein [Candidatus Cyanaurora vandensis]|uniref:glycosyltransferase family 2 protein n=1 Tax=Candidatus Cyanaurora vandensis TaxID=2714958 RepID=UPI00257A0387|nr:glycosyltransferase family 2 protein [Candidatus Cyanaurora vandensis]